MKKFLFLAILFLAAPFFYLMDGSLLKDIGLKADTLAPAYIMTTDRKCRSKVFVFHDCSYKYVYDNEEHKQDYFFFAFGAPETLTLLRGNNTGKITSDVGQDYLINRIATLLAFPAFGLFMILKGPSRNPRADRQPIPSAPPARQSPQTVPASSGLGKRAEFGKRK